MLANISHTLREMAEDPAKPQLVQMDVPFLIRLLEVAREDIKSDDELHSLVSKLLTHAEVLTMDSAGGTLSK